MIAAMTIIDVVMFVTGHGFILVSFAGFYAVYLLLKYVPGRPVVVNELKDYLAVTPAVTAASMFAGQGRVPRAFLRRSGLRGSDESVPEHSVVIAAMTNDVAAAAVDAIVAHARDMYASANADLARCKYGTKHYRGSTVSAVAEANRKAAEGVVSAIVGADHPAIPKILAGADWRAFVVSRG